MTLYSPLELSFPFIIGIPASRKFEQILHIFSLNERNFSKSTELLNSFIESRHSWSSFEKDQMAQRKFLFWILVKSKIFQKFLLSEFFCFKMKWLEENLALKISTKKLVEIRICLRLFLGLEFATNITFSIIFDSEKKTQAAVWKFKGC